MLKPHVFVLMLIALLGCTTDENGEDEFQGDTFNLFSLTSTVIPLQYVIVTTDNLDFPLDSYPALFGDVAVELIKVNDNEFIFTVPQISPGNQTLELTVDGLKGFVGFLVEANTVQNSESVLATQLIEPISEFNQEIDLLLSDHTFSSTVNDQLVSAQQMLSDFMQKYNTLSEAEKLEMAQFYNANPLFTSDYLDLSNRGGSGNSDYDCFNVNSKRVVLTTVSLLAFVSALPHLNLAGPFGSIAAFAGFVAGVYAAQAIISAAHELLINECFLPFEHALMDTLGNSDNFEVSNGTFSSFSLSSTDRHLIASDIVNSNAVVSFTMEKINVVVSKWNRLKNGINSIIASTTGWFSSWFPSASNFEPISYEFEEIPDTSEYIESDGASEFITLEDFPSDVDVEVTIASNSSINLKLNANEATLPRTVTGTIKYDDGDFVTEDSVTITIDNEDPCLTMTAPIISNLRLVCDGRVKVLFDFTADGVGALIGNGFGSCDPVDLCYPTRLYFRNPGAPEFTIAANSYTAYLETGTVNDGTAAIEIFFTGSYCGTGQSAAQDLENNFPGYEWKVELLNQCNQRSSQISF